MLKNLSKNLGEVKERTTVKVTFKIGAELTSEIYSMEASCGCSTPTIVDDKIVVSFNAQSIPTHLRHRGFYTKTANISVRYNDGELQTLYITAKVIL